MTLCQLLLLLPEKTGLEERDELPQSRPKLLPKGGQGQTLMKQGHIYLTL